MDFFDSILHMSTHNITISSRSFYFSNVYRLSLNADAIFTSKPSFLIRLFSVFCFDICVNTEHGMAKNARQSANIVFAKNFLYLLQFFGRFIAFNALPKPFTVLKFNLRDKTNKNKKKSNQTSTEDKKSI